YFNDEMGAAIMANMAESDAMLMGRVNYQEWAAFWPNQPADDEMVARFNSIPKFVVSNTLTSADWNNSTIISGDVAAELASLKEQPGKTIAMSGSATLVRWLLANDLIDQLHVMIHPIVVGSGQRLFEGPMDQLGLKLAGSQTFDTGVVYLTYERAADPAGA
ncbi:MAG TPA: dihydrofolate reductase family protein, partial [Herpetosiphonaceae bacterium]|nr:dihydrofolate reductase family protein [Herpetosiphonaceae bacterium]